MGCWYTDKRLSDDNASVVAVSSSIQSRCTVKGALGLTTVLEGSAVCHSHRQSIAEMFFNHLQFKYVTPAQAQTGVSCVPL